ncbi:hypothetical protein SARC_07150 [Sphaeroforma arctica JP610]|uniref:Uncharacterized protein n=1 Tax=Sphaeroforma arctica JP610 TaxID=667725 RepID=A0A0L0FV25_9EUKA|nr:hypothetical protein SARC_07150 [Sphaeroforma arctica JP610]KNC80489.1 hypothetical protein SARC_07150 [Sphaeroforma arctica JP610]|eukprot:XP_014154391.1 hypothetical protein SARC_07150 [Sphaeroforma arctica JP610]
MSRVHEGTPESYEPEILCADSWKLFPDYIEQAQQLFGPNNVDVFVSPQNEQLLDFWIKDEQKGAFEHNLSLVDGCPPWQLIHKDGASATVCLPWLPRAPWFDLFKQLLQSEPVLVPRIPHTFLKFGKYACGKILGSHSDRKNRPAQ